MTSEHIAEEFKDEEGNLISGAGGAGLPFQSGNIYKVLAPGQGVTYGTSDFSIKSGRLSATPIFVESDISVDKLLVPLQGNFVAPSTGKLRLGLWDSNPAGGGPFPGVLLADSGEIDVNLGSNEFVFAQGAIAPSVVLTPGVYWLGHLSDNDNPMTTGVSGRTLTGHSDGRLNLGTDEALWSDLTFAASPGTNLEIFGWMDFVDTARVTDDALPDPFPLGDLVPVTQEQGFATLRKPARINTPYLGVE